MKAASGAAARSSGDGGALVRGEHEQRVIPDPFRLQYGVGAPRVPRLSYAMARESASGPHTMMRADGLFRPPF